MFSFKFIKKNTSDDVILIPRGIQDTFVINGKDELGVFMPQTIFGDFFREKCAANNDHYGVDFSNGLLCAADRFHDPVDIYREVSHALDVSGCSVPSFEANSCSEVGNGVEATSGIGSHDLVSCYLLVDQNDHSQWFSFIRVDRTIFPYTASSDSVSDFSCNDKKLVFNINNIHCFIKPKYASVDKVSVLAGGMIGSLIGNELEQIALDLKKSRQPIEVNIGLDSVKCEDAFGLFSGVSNEIKRSINLINEEPEIFSRVTLGFAV